MEAALKVPVLGRLRYDYRNPTYTFESYPTLNGVEGLDKDPSNFFALNDETFRLRFVQDWLFFGLLQEWMAYQFWEYYEHVQRENLCLEELQERIVLTGSQRPFTQCLRTQNLGTVLEFAAQAFANINQRNEETTSGLFPLVLLSVEIALETMFALVGKPLWRALPWRRAYENSKPSGRWPNINLETSPSAIPLSTSMIAKGWCYHELNHLFRRFRTSTVLFLGSLGRAHKDHSACIDAPRCTVNDIIDNETAECKHTEDYRCHFSPQTGWKCKMITADFNQMSQILDMGGIPVLRVRDGNEGVQADYVDASTVSSYTAVSHLWADGLGNSRDNAIPLCQLRRLLSGIKGIQRADSKSLGFWRSYWRECLNFEDYRNTQLRPLLFFRAPASIYPAFFVAMSSFLRRLRQVWKSKEDVTFIWLDVYSITNVPKTGGTVTGEIRDRMQKLKTMGIARMTPTYALAEYVMILEKEVHETSEDTELTELVARQAISPWRTRYWTAQEASLASRAFFITRDDRAVEVSNKNSIVTKRLVAIHDKINRGLSHSLSIADMLLLDMCDTIDMDAFLGRDIIHYSSTLRVYQALSTWQYLTDKTSSEPGDLQCITANLMDFDASDVYQLEPGTRMKGIWKNFREFPLSLVFSPFRRICYDPKNKTYIAPADEDRWIPQLPGNSTLLWAKKQSVSQPVGILAEDGLRINVEALVGHKEFGIMLVELESADLARSRSRFILDLDGVQFWVQLHYDKYECHERVHRRPGMSTMGGHCEKADCKRYHSHGFEVEPPTSIFQKVCLILAYGEKLEDGGGGARIGVLSHDEADGAEDEDEDEDETRVSPQLTSIYDCAITFGPQIHVCLDKTFVKAPEIRGRLIENNPQILFKCGEYTAPKVITKAK